MWMRRSARPAATAPRSALWCGPDEFNMGLSSRKAIYSPFPQAVPSAYVLNTGECLGNNPVVCGKCVEACEKKCIDFHMSDESSSNERWAPSSWPPGWSRTTPRELDEYGYTRFRNVLTSIEFERLINAGGPTQGHLVRPTDRKRPRSVGFIQCVGSRSARRRQALLLQRLLHEHGQEHAGAQGALPGHRAEGLLHRHPGLRQRLRGSLHAKPAAGRSLRPGTARQRSRRLADGSLRVAVENSAGGAIEYYELDMLVLAIGRRARRTTQKLQEMLGLQLTSDGFFLEAHPKLQPVDAATRGVFYAGCAEGPKDIKESVTQASAAAARAIRLMQPSEICGRGHHLRSHRRALQVLRHVRRGLPLQRHHRRPEEEDPGRGDQGRMRAAAAPAPPNALSAPSP